MNYKSTLVSFVLCASFFATAQAQSSYEYNSDNASTYSRYGIGTLMPRVNGYNASMGGAGLAIMSPNRFNPANPASYSSLEAQTFILDAGMSLDQNRIKFNGVQKSSMASRLSYVNAAFRLTTGLGLSFGYMPMSSIGYDYTTSSHVGWNMNTGQEVRSSNTYFGTGGLHNVFLGLGYAPIKSLAVGVNFGFIWGEYNHAVTQAFTENGASSSGYSSQTTLYQANIASYNLEFGAQYSFDVNTDNKLNIAAVVGLGHNLGATAHYYRYATSGDTTQVALPKAFEMPMSYSIGVAWQRKSMWKVALDASYEQWKSCKSPKLQELANGDKEYVVTTAEYCNRLSLRLGGELCPNSLSRSYWKRMSYRIGAYYHTPYVKVNGADGPKEYGVTAGIALPITNKINNRSTVNIGVEWNRVKPSVARMIAEDRLSLRIGLTFGEQWFMKWKIR